MSFFFVILHLSATIKTLCKLKNCTYTVYSTVETCRCPKRLSTFKRPSSLDKGGRGGISEVIGNVIIESCGDCIEHGKSELEFTSVDDGESNVRFPVEVKSPRGSEFSKFVAVLEVPGVLIIKRRDGSEHRISEEVMTSSVFDTWPVIAVSLLMIYFAGVIVWFLVSFIVSFVVFLEVCLIIISSFTVKSSFSHAPNQMQ